MRGSLSEIWENPDGGFGGALPFERGWLTLKNVEWRPSSIHGRCQRRWVKSLKKAQVLFRRRLTPLQSRNHPRLFSHSLSHLPYQQGHTIPHRQQQRQQLSQRRPTSLQTLLFHALCLHQGRRPRRTDLVQFQCLHWYSVPLLQ